MKNQTVRFLFLITLIFSLMAPSAVAHAAGITVNSLEDSIAPDGKCPLREAIQNANYNDAANADCIAGSGADTIAFSVSGTITLGCRLPTIDDAAGLTIDSAGQTATISGNHLVSVMQVDGMPED